MSTPDVTICIPAWQAEPFISRTLTCAQTQTYENVRILVSIDQSTDQTEAICRHHAASDPRFDVRVHAERLGWSENSNFCLDQVYTEFCFFYFHDDIIEPTYTERLRQELIDDSQAQSAHSDIAWFGDRQGMHPGIDCEGTTVERLIKLLVGPVHGAPLRSMFRSTLLKKGLRFPNIAGDGFWRAPPFQMKLLGSGPSKRVPEALYRRWIREGSLTRTWKPKDQDSLVAGLKESAALCFDILRSLRLPPVEEHAVRFCIYIFMMTRMRIREAELNCDDLIKPEAISDMFPRTVLPADLSTIAPSLVDMILRAHGKLHYLEGQYALRKGDLDSALLSFATALSLNPDLAASHLGLQKILTATGKGQDARAVQHRRALHKALMEGN